jgi:DNA-binding transcriptional MerR regulator
MEKSLPPIPAKRYFTIGEVGELCDVKPHVLRYWEQEFTQLRPVKRRGNRRYYQHHEVLMIRRISDLLYSQGFTISGARNQLQELAQLQREGRKNGQLHGQELEGLYADAGSELNHADLSAEAGLALLPSEFPIHNLTGNAQHSLRNELLEIRELLSV